MSSAQVPPRSIRTLVPPLWTCEYVNKLEAGKYDPTVGMLKRLAKALGVPPAALLG